MNCEIPKNPCLPVKIRGFIKNLPRSSALFAGKTSGFFYAVFRRRVICALIIYVA